MDEGKEHGAVRLGTFITITARRLASGGPPSVVTP
jgi:hypothetical protein